MLWHQIRTRDADNREVFFFSGCSGQDLVYPWLAWNSWTIFLPEIIGICHHVWLSSLPLLLKKRLWRALSPPPFSRKAHF